MTAAVYVPLWTLPAVYVVILGGFLTIRLATRRWRR